MGLPLAFVALPQHYASHFNMSLSVVGLMLTYWCFSVLTIAHQAWGARWGGTAVQRAQWVAWREGAALAGVMLASVMPSLAGQAATQWLMVTGLALPLLAWLGYQSGSTNPAALQALAWGYGAIPCLLKCAAALVLLRTTRHQAPFSRHSFSTD